MNNKIGNRSIEFMGPPNTGKTYLAKELESHLRKIIQVQGTQFSAVRLVESDVSIVSKVGLIVGSGFRLELNRLIGFCWILIRLRTRPKRAVSLLFQLLFLEASSRKPKSSVPSLVIFDQGFVQLAASTIERITGPDRRFWELKVINMLTRQLSPDRALILSLNSRFQNSDSSVAGAPQPSGSQQGFRFNSLGASVGAITVNSQTNLFAEVETWIAKQFCFQNVTEAQEC